ncbi:MAG: glutamate--tRNA ligase [Rhizobiales bacterium]|nr:glutamate--tRNA ligase [Hyphomicrobiales bacterium]
MPTDKKPVVRFAPSPTGMLHLGNARAALFNWLFAKHAGGKFMLRMDDTDDERSTAAYAEGIENDLAWLGLRHDLFDRQSNRIAIYEAAAQRLKDAGLLYPCYETAAELDRKRKRQQARGKPPVYDRAALDLTAEDRATLEAEGRKPHWRFKLDGSKTHFEDLIFGAFDVNSDSLSDPVLVREDGRFLYTLPSVVDDIDFGITHIIRGADHLTNTGVQLQLFKALGATAPTFAHYSLLQGPEGKPLSKSQGEDFSLQSLREAGYEPMAINSLLARLGTPDPVEPRLSLEELAAHFDIGQLGRADIRFDPANLDKTNAALLHLIPYTSIRGRLGAAGIDLGEDFWNAIRPNLTRFDDAALWAGIITGPMTPVIEDEAFGALAAGNLPPEPWSDQTWGILTDNLKQISGRKGKALFMPLRLALTGLPHGPELKNLLPLIGRERAESRLRGLTR